jgi:hypothetical protein
MNRRLMVWAFIVLLAQAGWVRGEVYKCPDTSGRPTYTNMKKDTVGKHCTLVTKEVTVIPSQSSAPELRELAARPTAGGGTNNNEGRRRILEAELQNEQQQLAAAKQSLAEQEAIRNGDERNYARVLDRLKPYQDAVDQHQKNIDQLMAELDRLK